MDKKTLNYINLLLKTVEDKGDGKRRVLVTISTKNPDRSNDVVEPKGIDVTNFIKNPVFMMVHNHKSIPVARAEELKFYDDKVTAYAVFPPEGELEASDIAYKAIQWELINASSIGFIPKEWEERQDENGFGYHFKKVELLEVSFVPVPDNQDALIIMRGIGASEEEQQRISKFLAENATKKTEEKAACDTYEINGANDACKTCGILKSGHKAIEKDVAEVTSLAWILADLNYIYKYFVNNKVAESVTEKMSQAIVLVMECIKEEAVMGKKEIAREVIAKDINLDEVISQLEKDLPQIAEKQGKVLSDANKKLVKSCIDNLQALYDASDAKEEPKAHEVDVAKSISIEALKIIQSSLRNQDKEIGLTLGQIKKVINGEEVKKNNE